MYSNVFISVTMRYIYILYRTKYIMLSPSPHFKFHLRAPFVILLCSIYWSRSVVLQRRAEYCENECTILSTVDHNVPVTHDRITRIGLEGMIIDAVTRQKWNSDCLYTVVFGWLFLKKCPEKCIRRARGNNCTVEHVYRTVYCIRKRYHRRQSSVVS